MGVQSMTHRDESCFLRFPSVHHVSKVDKVSFVAGWCSKHSNTFFWRSSLFPCPYDRWALEMCTTACRRSVKTRLPLTNWSNLFDSATNSQGQECLLHLCDYLLSRSLHNLCTSFVRYHHEPLTRILRWVFQSNILRLVDHCARTTLMVFKFLRTSW